MVLILITVERSPSDSVRPPTSECWTELRREATLTEPDPGQGCVVPAAPVIEWLTDAGVRLSEALSAPDVEIAERRRRVAELRQPLGKP